VITLPVAQSTRAPLLDQHVSVEGTVFPVPKAVTEMFAFVTSRTISLNDTVTGPTTPLGVASVATGATVSGEGIVTGVKSELLYQSRSTQPEIPGTVPQLLYCQNAQGDPEQGVSGVGHRGGVPRPVGPSVRARVDHGAHAGAGRDLAQPREDPRRELGLREVPGSLEVEDRHDVPRSELGGVDEMVGLADRIVGVEVGPSEVVGTEVEPRRHGARAVRRVHGVDGEQALGGLRDDEPLTRGRHLCPVDRALMVRHVDPRYRLGRLLRGDELPNGGVD
jgi:hypothetical protein